MSNKCIDMKSMLPNSYKEALSLMVKAGQIELQQSPSSKTPITINQCTDAFLVFSIIF